MHTMNLQVKRLDTKRFYIDVGYSTGVLIIPISLLDAYYPGGTEEYVNKSKADWRTPIIVDEFLFKPLGPYDSAEYNLMKIGFVPEEDFTGIGAKPSRWFLDGPKVPISSPKFEIILDPENIVPSSTLRDASPIGTSKWEYAMGKNKIKRSDSIFTQQTIDQPWGVIDASILYGAARIYNGLHDNPFWEYAKKYRREDDQSLFLEFLHTLLLYQKLILDDSSVDEIGKEITNIIQAVNEKSGYVFIETQKIGDRNQVQQVAYSIAKLVDNLPTKYRLAQIQVPWAYHDSSHYDYDVFRKYLVPELRPVTTFAFRGLIYAAFAKSMSQMRQAATVYVAASGRLAALEPLLSQRDVQQLGFPKNEYLSLMKQLDLPVSGLQFDYLSGTLPNHEISDLARYVLGMTANQALDFVLDLRNSTKGFQLRTQWNERILGNSSFGAIGPAVSQSVQNSVIHGSLNLYICAKPLAQGQQFDNLRTDVSKGERVMNKARQSMKKVKVGKDVRQASNNPETMQEIDELETKGNLEQVIDAGTNQSTIEELNRLIPLLKEALAELPKDSSENVMKVAKRAEAISEEANKDKPDKEKLEITGESLLLAANNMANIAPTVLTIASQVVQTISKLIQ